MREEITNKQSMKDYQLLQISLLQSNKEGFEKVLRTADVKDVSRTGMNILHYAITMLDKLPFPFEELLILLQSQGLPVSMPNHDGYTPLHFAIEGKRVEVVKTLLTYGHPVDVQDSRGFSPLYVAVNLFRGEESLAEIIRVLTAYNANWELKNNSGNSPRDIVTSLGDEIDDNLNPKSWDLRPLLEDLLGKSGLSI